jgi:high affinity Mn2+ porin
MAKGVCARSALCCARGVAVACSLLAPPPAGAQAADVAARPAFTGFYFGAQAGAALPAATGERLQAVNSFQNPGVDLFPANPQRPGPTFGLHVGYDWRRENLVYGLETELNFLGGQSDLGGIFPAPPAYWPLGAAAYALSSSTGGAYFGAFRGRLGVASDHALAYVTGGVATGGWRGPSTLSLAGAAHPENAGESTASRMKYLLGAGLEYALDANWSARAEYLFLNQSHTNQIFGDGAGVAYSAGQWSTSHVFRFGVDYRVPETGDAAAASDAGDGAENANMHGQVTFVSQGYPKFPALYSGPQSLAPPSGQARATLSATGFFGLRLWEGGEAYVNPEIEDGYGLSDTYGVAGFPSAEAYKLGREAPYARFQRFFVRQTFGLGGGSERVDSGANQLAGSIDANRLTFTVGKYSVVDLFDDNRYAHDGRNGFMNWTVIDMGAFDYAADSWGYTYGATTEWRQDWWTARAGLFQLSRVPNSPQIEPVLFRQFSQIAEFEARQGFLGQPGKIKLLVYGDLGYLGKYDQAIALGLLTDTTPEVSLTRKRRFKAGGGVNIEQPLTEDLGVFFRASRANGRYETDEFTEVERSVSGGLVVAGEKWGRPKDAIGTAGVVNGVSRTHADYLAAGGLGIMLGDGRLTYGREKILETYYKYNLFEGAHVTADYQFVQNPGYNRERGPVSIFSVRLHSEF